MRRILRSLLAVGLLASLAAVPAGADEFEPDLTPQRVYFHCNGDVPVTNVHSWIDSSVPSWDENAPTQSVEDGAGCGTADTAFTGTADHNPIYDAPFEGFFNGNIDSLTLHLYNIDAGYARMANEIDFELLLQIDGVTYHPRDVQLTAPLEDTNSGVARYAELTIIGIGLTAEEDNAEHHVQLTLANWYLDSVSTWVFDTTEVPAGITFNPDTFADTIVAASG